MILKYVTKIYRQHTTLVTSIPFNVRAALELTSGDNLLWQVDENSDFVQISKVVPRGGKHDGAKGNISK